MSKSFWSALIVVSVILHAHASTDARRQTGAQESPETAELPAKDKAELIRLTLERALVDKKIPDYNVIAKQDSFLLSTENISAELVPEIKGVKLIPLAPEAIKERAETDGSYVYYFRFRKFEVEGEKVLVPLDNIPMYAKKPERLAFGGGFTIEYEKKNGEWVGTEKINWIV
jgi:hypothetical protein